MSCNHVRPMIVLNRDKSSTTENYTFRIIGPAWTTNTISPKEVVEASLNPNSIRTGFSKADGGNSICLNADICNRSAKLFGSTKIYLTSKSLILSVRMRVSLYGCNT